MCTVVPAPAGVSALRDAGFVALADDVIQPDPRWWRDGRSKVSSRTCKHVGSKYRKEACLKRHPADVTTSGLKTDKGRVRMAMHGRV